MDNKASLFGKFNPSTSSTAPSASATKGKTMGLTSGLTTSTGTGRKPGATGGITSSGVTLSPEVRAKKIEEGRDFSERGMKCLKVTVFQWKPDHLLAAPLFESSSNAYKAAGELEQARVMMVQCAKSHEGYGASSTAAVALMNAAKIAQSQQNSIHAAEHLKEASELWGSYGDTDKCADVLSKAAKELEAEEPEEALALYQRGNYISCFLLYMIILCTAIKSHSDLLTFLSIRHFHSQRWIFLPRPTSPRSNLPRSTSISAIFFEMHSSSPFAEDLLI